MAEPPSDPDSGTLRWVYMFGIVAAVLLVIFVVVHLAGGGMHHHGR